MKIKLIDCGPKKIAVIKGIRAATGLNLRDAKDISDRAPITFDCHTDLSPEGMKNVVRGLHEAGATFEAELESSAIDKMTAASYIHVAETALGEGNVTEARNALKSALRLLGAFVDERDWWGVQDQR